jgi:TRAP-type C4-dicarboxylate transport system substrate-binding protein
MAAVTARIGGYQAEASILTRAIRRLAASLGATPAAEWQVEVVRDVTERGARAADLLAMVESGTVEICYFASGYLAGRVPSLGAFDEPFPELDRTRLFAELDGEPGARLAGDLARLTGYTLLGCWDNGVRHITNRLRPIRHPGDCRGMRIRTLDNAAYQRVLAAIGFAPLVIDVKDLVRAVESHEVDAQENPLTNTVNFGLHAIHKHLSLTSHFHGVALLLANRTWFEALAPQVQAGVLAAAADATTAQRQWAIDEDAVCLERLRREGVTIVPPEQIDFPAFRALVSDPPPRRRPGLIP